jgi:hypothetical protein
MTERNQCGDKDYLKQLALSIIDDSPVLFKSRAHHSRKERKRKIRGFLGHRASFSSICLVPKLTTPIKICDQSLSEYEKGEESSPRPCFKKREIKLAHKRPSISSGEGEGSVHKYIKVKPKRRMANHECKAQPYLQNNISE